MLNVEYSKRFLKDLKKLKKTNVYKKIHDLCFSELPNYDSITNLKHLKKLEGYTAYFRISLGEYRIGLKVEGNRVIVMRVLHRKEIYRFFP